MTHPTAVAAALAESLGTSSGAGTAARDLSFCCHIAADPCSVAQATAEQFHQHPSAIAVGSQQASCFACSNAFVDHHLSARSQEGQ